MEAFAANLVGVSLLIRRRLSWWKQFCLLQRLVKWQTVKVVFLPNMEQGVFKVTL